MSGKSSLILGTAMWGWTLRPETCFHILDAYYEQGGRWIDGATNYPINKEPKDFRRAEKILEEWIQVNGVRDLQIMMKVGSINNLYTPENNLAPSFLLLCTQEYQQAFGDQLKCLMIHWDNREDPGAIQESLQTLTAIPGIQLGLSGIKYPDVYAAILAKLELNKVWLQLKHNVVYSDYERYRALHAKTQCIAYGINAGGIKLQEASYNDNASLLARGGAPEKHRELVLALRSVVKRFAEQKSRPIVEKMNHLGLLYALLHPGIARVLIGVSSVDQLQDSFAWERIITQHDYRDWYNALIEVVKTHVQK